MISEPRRDLLRLSGTYVERLFGGAPVGHSLLMVTNTLTLGLGGYLLWTALAHRYTPATIGLASSCVSLMVLSANLGQLGLGVGLVRYYAYLGPRRRRLLSWMVAGVLLAAISGAGAVLAVVLVAGSLRQVLGQPVAWCAFVGASAMWAASLLHDSYLIARQEGHLLVAKSVIAVVVRLLAVLAIPLSVTSLLLLLGGSALLSSLVTLPLSWRAGWDAPDHGTGPSWRELWSYSLWNHLTGLSGVLPPLMIPVVVTSLAGPEEAGVYYLAWSLYTLVQVVPAAMNWTLFAQRSRWGPAESREQLGCLASLALLLAAVPCWYLLLTVIGHAYLRQGMWTLLALGVGLWPYYRTLWLTAHLRVVGGQAAIALASVLGQIAFLALSVPLVVLMGAPGAGLAWSCGQFVSLVLLTMEASKALVKEVRR